MKIIILGPAHPYRGGISDTNEALCRNLQSQGHKVSIWTFRLQYPTLLFPGKTQFSESERPKGISIKRKINSISPWNWIRVAHQINKKKPDLILVRYWTPFLALSFGSIVKRLDQNIKKIAVTDNILPHELMPFHKLLTRFFCKQFDGFITLSKAVASELNHFIKKPILVLPHPINDQLPTALNQLKAQQSLGLNATKKYLLFFGLVRQYKGLDLLIQAMPSVLKKHPNTHLLVVGEHYESINKYRNLAKALHIEPNVTFENKFVSEHEMAKWFSASDLVVQPYKSASQSGITPLALWFNKPTVVTQVGGLFESVIDQKTGWIVAPSVTGITSGILEFLETKNLFSILESIESEQKKLSWSHFCTHCIEFNNTLE